MIWKKRVISKKHAIWKMLGSFAVSCVILPPSIDLLIVVSPYCGNGQLFCATVCLTS